MSDEQKIAAESMPTLEAKEAVKTPESAKAVEPKPVESADAAKKLMAEKAAAASAEAGEVVTTILNEGPYAEAGTAIVAKTEGEIQAATAEAEAKLAPLTMEQRVDDRMALHESEKQEERDAFEAIDKGWGDEPVAAVENAAPGLDLEDDGIVDAEAAERYVDFEKNQLDKIKANEEVLERLLAIPEKNRTDQEKAEIDLYERTIEMERKSIEKYKEEIKLQALEARAEALKKDVHALSGDELASKEKELEEVLGSIEASKATISELVAAIAHHDRLRRHTARPSTSRVTKMGEAGSDFGAVSEKQHAKDEPGVISKAVTKGLDAVDKGTDDLLKAMHGA